jgi:arylsulfatase A-like enzyme
VHRQTRTDATVCVVRRLGLGSLAVAVFTLAGATPVGQAPPSNLVLILVDTLRADHLTSYGDARNPSPHLAAFARESIVFENATSQASCTFPSMNSLLTSRYPGEFLTQPDKDFGIPNAIPSLAVILQRAGYATYAVSASPIVRNTPSHFNATGGYGAGFDRFDERCEWRSANCVNLVAREMLSTAATPFALYLHYLDPHAPYRPPRSFPRRFSGRYAGDKEFVRKGDPRPIEKMIYSEGPDVDLSEGDLAHLKELYADEVAYLDGSVGWLLDRLRERGLLDRSIVVLAADHGEAFLEHGDVHHCHELYETSVATPLMLRLPHARSAGRRQAVVQNLDILPTLLDYLGVDASAYHFSGRSLRPVIEGAGGTRFAYSGQGVLRGVRDARYKLIYDTETRSTRLYDLAEDPRETRDLSEERPAEHQRLRAALETWMAEHEPRPEPDADTNVGRGLEERLRELGYVE